MTKSFAFFIFCWGDTLFIFILFQSLCDHFDCGLERCATDFKQTNRNSHTYQEVLSE